MYVGKDAVLHFVPLEKAFNLKPFIFFFLALHNLYFEQRKMSVSTSMI